MKPLHQITYATLFAFTSLFASAGYAAAPRDLDRDGIPNITDRDTDNDGIPNSNDLNVDGGIAISGPLKGRYIGDRLLNSAKAETDIDGDGLADNSVKEFDMDGDGLADNSALEDDIDGDGLDDDSNAETDIDGDSLLDDARAETDMDGDGLGDNALTETDIDGDGDQDNSTEEEDIDGDGRDDDSDAETDIDGDGREDDARGETDIDGDGLSDNDEDEADIDGDGELDVTLGEEDIDGDGRDDDSTEENDSDGDGVVNENDNDVDGDGISNEDDTDTNGDGIADEFEVEFGATAVAGTGEAGGEFRRYEFDGTRIALSFGVEGVPVGQYTISVGGIVRGTFVVSQALPEEDDELEEDGEVEDNSASEEDGEVEEDGEAEDDVEDSSGQTWGGITFAANPTEEYQGSFPLNFAPAGAAFEIKLGDQVYFTGMIPVPQIIVNSFYAVAVQEVGEAGGEYEGWEGDGSNAVLGLGIEGAPLGVYDVFIGGVQRGTISVIEVFAEDDDEEEEGEDGEDGSWTCGVLTFAKKANDPGVLPLDFDPAGAAVVIKLGDTVYYTATIPTPPAVTP